MEVLHQRCAGIDVHRDGVVACARVVHGQGIERFVETFGTATAELERLARWLAGHGVTHAAMEATGVYWKPVWAVLAEAFELVLANAMHVRNVPGRKAYRREPSRRRRAGLRVRFDRIFRRRTGFVMLDRLLERLYANKAELLRVLDHPEIPLHTNGSENDIRAQVTRRKVSGGTRSDTGRDCRDAFLGLAKTCAKLGLSFWDYLGDRLGIPGQRVIPYLPDLVRGRCQPA